MALVDLRNTPQGQASARAYMNWYQSLTPAQRAEVDARDATGGRGVFGQGARSVGPTPMPWEVYQDTRTPEEIQACHLWKLSHLGEIHLPEFLHRLYSVPAVVLLDLFCSHYLNRLLSC